jgi:hypothetical protein
MSKVPPDFDPFLVPEDASNFSISLCAFALIYSDIVPHGNKQLIAYVLS